MNKIVLLSILALFSSSILLTQIIFAQTVENEIRENTLDTVENATNSTTLKTINPKDINQNSLVACVDYLINEYETQKEGLSESVQQGLDSTINENMLNLISVAICDIGYEHTGKYSHLLPKDMQNKYAKLAATQILLEKKSFETFTNPDPLDPEMFLNKLLSPSTVNASALGNEQSKITIVEFADYQCPFCAQFNKETKGSVIENFVDTGKAKFLYKDLIVNDGRDKASTLAATASYCAAEQGKYWEYHDELFKNSKGENTGWVTKNNLNQFANNIRVPDLMKFSDCVDTGKYNQIVSENDSFARNIGLTSTPSFVFYNGTTPVAIQGAQPYEAFEQIITAIE